MSSNIVSLTPASSSDNLRALAEVSDFATTDMDRGGHARWTYRIVPEPRLTAELTRVANAKSFQCTDCVSFQPCPSYEFRSQDRYTVEEWELPGGKWLFNAIFDGHSNHDTVDYVLQTLPSEIKMALQSALKNKSNSVIALNVVSKIISDAIIRLDDSISSNFLGLFLRDPGHLDHMTDTQIRNIIQDGSTRPRSAVVRCLGGTTALLSLTDPQKKNLWVANLGDCQAVLGVRGRSGRWSGTLINSIHNGTNPVEVQRVRAEHPGEQESIDSGRVIGFLAPTRAIGDTWLKLPALYTRRVFVNFDQEWMTARRANEYAARILTPPYVSNIPEVYHRVLPSTPSFLILCSDGLTDLYEEMGQQEMVNHWVQVVSQALELFSCLSDQRTNLALRLLRDAIGGEDATIVSRNITVEMEERWMDDTTIVVQRL